MLALTDGQWIIKASYLTIVIATMTWGIGMLALQNCPNSIWTKSKTIISLALSILAVMIFMASVQPYAAFLSFVFLLIKGVILMKGR